jgi:predicted pyridoxine 5'-phosphate oxidase superfamily flavin-nucleotide-binding protein
MRRLRFGKDDRRPLLFEVIAMSHKFFDLTFTPSVKAAQEHYGTRRNYARYEGGESDFYGLSDREIDFIEARDGFYMATVNEDGQPYIQFRGGPQGFLKVLDDHTLGYADFRGNLQYISVGNLKANDKAALFLMDYPNQARLKLLVRVEVKDAKDAPEILEKLAMPGYKAKVERAMVLHVEAFDWNCPQHITPRYTIDEIRSMTAPLSEHIEKLEKEIAELKADVKKRI